MFRVSRWLTSIVVVAVSLCMIAPPLQAQSGYGPRQYYGHWTKHSSRNFHYRHYYYKPTPTYRGYKHHYVVFTPKDPKHLYFYNPYKKQYWGRCPVDYGDKPVYSMLKPADRKATIKEVPEGAFPPPGELPPLPDATDDAVLELPPDDLPTSVDTPADQ